MQLYLTAVRQTRRPDYSLRNPKTFRVQFSETAASGLPLLASIQDLSQAAPARQGLRPASGPAAPPAPPASEGAVRSHGRRRRRGGTGPTAAALLWSGRGCEGAAVVRGGGAVDAA